MNLWERRIERAFLLEQEFPAAAELLRFYREIAAFQKKVAATGDPARFRHPLLELLERRAPRPLANAARQLSFTKDWDPADPAPRFVRRVLEQCAPGEHAHDRPLCAVLRPEGDGGKRSLMCAVCFAEWEFNRIRCPGCGEEDEKKLPVYTAAQFGWVRIEACDSCRSYTKAIDLTKNGLAVPEVDEIAAVALDVWAAEQGYTKLCPNLFGL